MRADTVEKLRRAKISSETWNIVLATDHFSNFVYKSGLSGEEVLIIRRVMANRRVFQQYRLEPDFRRVLHERQLCPCPALLAYHSASRLQTADRLSSVTFWPILAVRTGCGLSFRASIQAFGHGRFIRPDEPLAPTDCILSP